MTLSPSGEAMRAGAERVLRERFDTLHDRSIRRVLTPCELTELHGLGHALNELLELEAPQPPSPGGTSGAAIPGETSEGQ